jgi:hypothetical protein
VTLFLARIKPPGTFVPITSKNSVSGCIKYGRGRGVGRREGTAGGTILIDERRNNPGSIAESENALQALIFRYH